MSSPATSPDGVPLGLRERGKLRRIGRILDAALELLREDSEPQLTIERIAERAEVSAATVYNLVGGREHLHAALADRALGHLDYDAITGADPHDRARRIVAATVRTLRSDAVVFRSLLSGWGHGGLVLDKDPTRALIRCLEDATDAGDIPPGVDVKLHGGVLAAGLIGVIHEWASGLLSDRAFGIRARAVVDVVFASARSTHSA